MKSSSLFFAVAHSKSLFVTIVALCVSAFAARAARAAEDEARMLLKERLAVLEEIFQGVTAQHKIGNADVKAVLEAQREVVNAKLELAESATERIAALEELLASAKRVEERASSQYELGLSPKMEILVAKAYRLRVAVDLAKEKSKD